MIPKWIIAIIAIFAIICIGSLFICTLRAKDDNNIEEEEKEENGEY